jgi:hypothetical protein
VLSNELRDQPPLKHISHLGEYKRRAVRLATDFNEDVIDGIMEHSKHAGCSIASSLL